ncbi:heme biosynthesis protein HemY [Vibrio profundum]|uniref:heme biosynthesis HemY N-terminal domain-containing protein n=1 Tax=Vibrio profundum TaxID=2910247 RepID=UPI003D097682
MFRLIFLFIVLGGGLFVGSHYAGQQGYVLISIANKTLEMSVTTLMIFVIAALAGLFILESILKKLIRSSSTTWQWLTVRKIRRARRDTNEGVIKWLEGDWKQAERKVTRRASHHDMPLLCYLVASEAALEMGEESKRDHYLQLAEKQADSKLVVSLTRAKQQIRLQKYQQAYDSLIQLTKTNPNHPLALQLLKEVYVELQKWQALSDILPQLRKVKALSEVQLQQLEVQVQCGLLSDIALHQSNDTLIQHWDQLAKKSKAQPEIIVHYAKLLVDKQASTPAFDLIKSTLKKQSIGALYTLLPEIELTDNQDARLLLEQALNKNGNNADALSALAQFEMKDKQWPNAQQHLEKSLSIRSSVRDYHLLATTLEQQNMLQAANDVSKKALTLVHSAQS